MVDKQWLRAVYDETRKAFIPRPFRYSHPEPEWFYQFELDNDDESEFHDVCLVKYWTGEDAGSEIFPFDFCTTEEEFDEIVAEIRAEAEVLVKEDNLDELLAIIDVIKQRSYEQDEDESWFGYEGLFELGPEDAYTLRERDGSGIRLHHHVEQPDDQCWHTHTAEVVDPDGNHLGWGSFAVFYPELPSSASEEAMRAVPCVLMLDMFHRKSQYEASRMNDGIEYFMTDGDRVQDPYYAYLNDLQILDWISLYADETNRFSPEWTELCGTDFSDFIDGKTPVVRTLEQWKPEEPAQPENT
jgi:hypothetical protein